MVRELKGVELRNAYKWTAMGQLVPQFASLVISIFMARLLGPEVYGVYALTSLFVMLITTFEDGGFSSALVQKPDIDENDRTTVFCLNTGLSLILGIALCIAAPLISRFYSQPVLVPMLRVQALMLFLGSFGIVNGVLLTRDMKFKRLAAIDIGGSLAIGVTGVVLAMMGCGVWSLIGSAFMGTCVKLVMNLAFSGWRPRGRFSIISIRKILGFSSALLGTKLLVDVCGNVSSVIIGKFYSPTQLGFYNKASALKNLPINMICGVVKRVSYPRFSRLQDDKELMLSSFRATIRGLYGLVLLLAGIVVLVADTIVPFLLGEKWRPVVPLLQIFIIGGLFQPLTVFISRVLNSQGFARATFLMEMIKSIVGILFLLVAAPYGVITMAWAVVGTSFISIIVSGCCCRYWIRYGFRMQLHDFGIIGCYLSVLVCVIVSMSMSIPSHWARAIMSALVYLVFWTIGVYVFREKFSGECWKMVQSVASILRIKWVGDGR